MKTIAVKPKSKKPLTKNEKSIVKSIRSGETPTNLDLSNLDDRTIYNLYSKSRDLKIDSGYYEYVPSEEPETFVSVDEYFKLPAPEFDQFGFQSNEYRMIFAPNRFYTTDGLVFNDEEIRELKGYLAQNIKTQFEFLLGNGGDTIKLILKSTPSAEDWLTICKFVRDAHADTVETEVNGTSIEMKFWFD